MPTTGFVAPVARTRLRAPEVGGPLGDDQRTAVVTSEEVDQRTPRVPVHLRTAIALAGVLRQTLVHVAASGLERATYTWVAQSTGQVYRVPMELPSAIRAARHQA